MFNQTFQICCSGIAFQEITAAPKNHEINSATIKAQKSLSGKKRNIETTFLLS